MPARTFTPVRILARIVQVRIILARMAVVIFVLGLWSTPLPAAEPVTIGFGMALTGGIAANGRAG